MCDTFVADQSTTRINKTLFAKNSDRPPNEAQHLFWGPAKTYPDGERVRCTYINIPQVIETHAILISKPWWMWGAEMGINDAGVVIGNEAIYSKIPANKKPALLGMDLLRLALERSTSSRQAIEVITSLLDKYGQGGNCVNKGEMYYHNSFLIADSQESWVLETIDKDWAAAEVEDIYSISNVLTISNHWDMASPGIQNQADIARDRFDLSKNYSDFLYTNFSNARQRCQRTQEILDQNRGKINVSNMAAILRDQRYHPDPKNGLTRADVCMHAGFGPISISQTTASWIAVLGGEQPLVFATGTSSPCTGIFKPIWVDAPIDDLGPDPTDTFDGNTLFWSHERLHRLVEQNYEARIKVFVDDRDHLEGEFTHQALALDGAPAEERAKFSAACFKRTADATEQWLGKVKGVTGKPGVRSFLHNLAWSRFSREAGMG